MSIPSKNSELDRIQRQEQEFKERISQVMCKTFHKYPWIRNTNSYRKTFLIKYEKGVEVVCAEVFHDYSVTCKKITNPYGYDELEICVEILAIDVTEGQIMLP